MDIVFWKGIDMADERRTTGKHNVVIDGRERVTVRGVIDVISFDEEAVISETDMGMLIVRGANLHVNRLNLESGELYIDGEVDTVAYEEEGPFKSGGASFFSKIFR